MADLLVMYHLLAQAAQTTTQTFTFWQQCVLMVLGAIITAFLVPFLNKLAAAQAAKIKTENLTQTGVVLAQAKEYALRRAADIAERQFPELAKRIIAGEISTPDQVKQVMKGWGNALKSETIQYFARQDVDLIAKLGDKAIDDLIESVANWVSPFPGMETAKVVLQDEVSNLIVQKGVAYVRSQASEFEVKDQAKE